MITRWAGRGLLAVAVAFLLAQWILSMIHPRGDFLLHWEFGRRLRTGTFLYEGGMHVPYPPAWAVLHVPLSLVSPHLAKPAFFLVGVAALAALLWLLNDLTRAVWPLKEGRLFWVGTATLFLTSRFVLRDFDDGGQNLFLLALSWMGLWVFARGRPLSAGAWLGLAISLKCTALLFVGYFLLKRRWGLVASSLLWCGVFSLSPVFWMGPTELARHLDSWKTCVLQGVSQPDPSVGVLGPEPLQNKSLRPCLARYLMRLPPGHPGRCYVDDLPERHPDRRPHPWSVDFLDLPPPVAGWIVKWALLAGLLVVAWLCRKPLEAGDRQTFLWETAAVSVLMLLYSPITWGQHCAATLPAFYLLLRSRAAGENQSWWLGGTLAGFAILFVVTNRSFVGRDLSLLLESYHLITFALLGLVVALLRIRPPDSRRETGG